MLRVTSSYLKLSRITCSGLLGVAMYGEIKIAFNSSKKAKKRFYNKIFDTKDDYGRY